jgi:Patatin-like phospholipase
VRTVRSAYRALVAACALFGIGACATYDNKQLIRPATPLPYPQNYTFDAWRAARGGVPDPAIVLSFSGGFLHAAALANATLKALRQYQVWICPTPLAKAEKDAISSNGKACWDSLLNHVVAISSTSGGSFANANFVVHGPSGLDSFENQFLEKNLAGSLLGQVAKRPWTWPQVIGPAADRSQFQIDNLNASLLKKGSGGIMTFRDLSAEQPFAMFGTTDYSAERHFVFTQESFDDLCSDAGQYPLADAVTASGAFPLLLTDVEVRNYNAMRITCPVAPKPAFDPADPATHSLAYTDKQRFLDERYSDSLRRAWVQYDPDGPSSNPPFHPEAYLHFFDGGIGDNLAVRPLIHLIDVHELATAFASHTILYVQVNARSDPPSGYDATQGSPYLPSLATGVPYDSIDSDTALSNYTALNKWAQIFFQAGEHPTSFAKAMYIAEVDYDQDADRHEQDQLKNLGGISLTTGEVRFVNKAANRLLL